jgi:formamidopyrimidine-DNA glycosylase
MPELPEVETIARGLAPRMEGLQVQDCILNRPNMRFAFPDNLQEVLLGATIEAVTRRAKYLLFRLSNGFTIIGHLGMSGTMRVLLSADFEPRKHDHVIWELSDGHVWVFHDPRRFGFLLLEQTDKLASHPMLAHLGPEPLSDDFSPEYFAKALSKRKTALKVALMDQKLVVGVGNIYASEALFDAHLSPFMPAYEAAKNAKTLLHSIQITLRDAIASGGSTLRDYARSDGDSGYFQHHFRVYGRADEPCVRCHEPIAHMRQAGRSTYFCYICQQVD